MKDYELLKILHLGGFLDTNDLKIFYKRFVPYLIPTLDLDCENILVLFDLAFEMKCKYYDNEIFICLQEKMY